MTGTRPVIIAVEGVLGASLTTAARTIAAQVRTRPAGISVWDASGIFGEVAVTEEVAGKPSARTLLLLYASDLAFRLRNESGPAFASGQPMVLAPYVNTAIAFASAAGIEPEWVADMLSFAPAPVSTEYANVSGGADDEQRGFVEFAAAQIAGNESKAKALIIDADRYLRALLQGELPPAVA